MADFDHQQTNPFAPPEARVMDAPVAERFELAARGTRLAAVILDWLCLFGAGVIAAIVIPATQERSMGATIAMLLIVLFVIAVLVINCVLLHRHGQTIGKKVLGIRVVRSDGGRIGLTRIFFLRFLPIHLLSAIPVAGGILSLLDSLLIFRATRKCLHDDFADTIVIRC